MPVSGQNARRLGDTGLADVASTGGEWNQQKNIQQAQRWYGGQCQCNPFSGRVTKVMKRAVPQRTGQRLNPGQVECHRWLSVGQTRGTGAPNQAMPPAVRMAAASQSPMRLSKPTSTLPLCWVGLPPKPNTKAWAGKATSTNIPRMGHMLPVAPGSVNNGHRRGQENADRQPA